jgi:hypothetical protein
VISTILHFQIFLFLFDFQNKTSSDLHVQRDKRDRFHKMNANVLSDVSLNTRQFDVVTYKTLFYWTKNT